MGKNSSQMLIDTTLNTYVYVTFVFHTISVCRVIADAASIDTRLGRALPMVIISSIYTNLTTAHSTFAVMPCSLLLSSVNLHGYI